MRAGKTRYIGVSNFTGAQVRSVAAALTDIPLAANQVGFNLFDRRWQQDAFATCEELGMGVMAYGPLAHGLLTGTFTPEMAFAETDWRAAGTIFGQPLLAPENFQRNIAVVERLRDIRISTGDFRATTRAGVGTRARTRFGRARWRAHREGDDGRCSGSGDFRWQRWISTQLKR